MTVTVSPTTQRATHHVKLSKGGTDVGLILTDSRGREVQRIERVPYPSRSINFQQGRSKYSDKEPPFLTLPLDDFSGGRGRETWEDDKTRYMDGWRMDTQRAGRMILGPQESYGGGDHRDQYDNLPGSQNNEVTVHTYYYANLFTADANYNVAGIEADFRKIGTPNGGMVCELWSESGAEPNAILKTKTIGLADMPSDVLSTRVYFEFASVQAVTNGTDYFVVFHAESGSDDGDNHWEILGDVTNSLYSNDNGTSWVPKDDIGFFFRVLDDTAHFDSLAFDYKGATYFVTQPHTGGNSFLYINGDRGAADDNSGDKSLLNDATKAWTADEWIGSIVEITNGPGAEESQPWREITDNDGTTLEVSPDWNVTHTTDTEYVIVKSDKIDQLQDLGAYVTDVAVADEFIYFARGDTGANNVLRYQAYNAGGTWTERTNAENVMARCLVAILNPTLGITLWGGWNEHSTHGNCVWYGRVPERWGDLYNPVGTLLDTDTPWDVRSVTNITNDVDDLSTRIQIAAGFTTGIAAVEDMDASFDISEGSQLGMLIKSSVGTNLGDLELVYDDSLDLGEAWFVPNGLIHWETAAQVDIDEAHRIDELSTGITVTSGGYIYVGVANAPEKFNKIQINLGTTKNAVAASTLTGEYWDGDDWQSLASFNDGTASGGVTLAQSGTITFDLPRDWFIGEVEDIDGYYVRLKPDKNLTANIDFEYIVVKRQANTELSIPALTAATWQWEVIDISPLAYPYPDDTEIQSIGLNVAVDNGAQVVHIRGGIQVLKGDLEYIRMPNDTTITGLERYSGNEDDPRENPWVLTDSQPYEIQTQSENIAVPLSLREMRALRSSETGRAHTVNDVYMWFNLGDKIERYYNRQLTDLGPDRDAGLPSDRQGTPSWMVSYPGRIYVGIDGGEDNYSSILVTSGGNSWHELYRSPQTGLRIRGRAGIQSIPGSSVGRLWFSHGADFIYIPVAVAPEDADDYVFCHEAALVTGRIHADLQDVAKYWSSVKMVTEDLSDNQVEIYVDYRTDGSINWTEISDYFNTSPNEELDISSSYNVSGKWIELRFRVRTYSNSVTPIIYAAVIEGIEIDPVKYLYPLVFAVEDNQRDLLGDPDDYITAQAKINQLDTWVGEATPLQLNTITALENAQYVFPQPVPVRTIAKFHEEEREVRICQLDLVGI